MSSVSEPLRPAYAVEDSAAAEAYSNNAGTSMASGHGGKRSADKKTASRPRVSRYDYSSQKKQGKGARKSAKSLMRAAYEPLRRVVASDGRQKGKKQRLAPEVSYEYLDEAASAQASSSEGRRTRSTAAPVAPVEVIDAPKAQEHPAAAGEMAAVIAAANASTGLAVTPSEADRLKSAEARLRESLQKYEAAMRQMEVRFEVLDRDLSLKKNRNPIHHIESRVKKPASIFEKLQRQGFPVTIESMEENLFDIAGVRVICSYIHDVYGLLELLQKQDDLEIVTIKDYIANPKPNGYRSLHVIVRIPVYFMDKKEMVPVEVQLRTIAMDFWASLEHSLKYKAVREVQGIDASDELKDCSRIIEDVEARMQILAKALEVEE